MLAAMVLSQHRFRRRKPFDLVLRVVPDIRGTPLGRGIRFVQRRHTHNSVKERDPI